MDDLVSKPQIGHGIFIYISAEVVVVRTYARTKAVISVDHARHTVEAVPIELEGIEPIATVGEKKMEGLDLTVIEESGIPRWVFTPSPLMEIKGIGPVKPTQSLQLILNGMGVNEIHNDGDAERVRRID